MDVKWTWNKPISYKIPVCNTSKSSNRPTFHTEAGVILWSALLYWHILSDSTYLNHLIFAELKDFSHQRKRRHLKCIKSLSGKLKTALVYKVQEGYVTWKSHFFDSQNMSSRSKSSRQLCHPENRLPDNVLQRIVLLGKSSPHSKSSH